MLSPADTPENRSYIQRQKLWHLGEIVSHFLVVRQPPDVNGAIAGVLYAEKQRPSDAMEQPSPTAISAAQSYLQRYQVASTIEEWLANVLDVKPVNPIDFSIDYFLSRQQAAGGIAFAESASPADGGGRTQTAPSQSALLSGGQVDASLHNDSPVVAPLDVPQPVPVSLPVAASTAVQQARRAPRLLVVFYSAYGHVKLLASAIEVGARRAGGDVLLRRVPETLPTDVVDKLHVLTDASIPECSDSDFEDADAVAFGFAGRFGGAPAQLLTLLERLTWNESTGPRHLCGKPAAAFTCTATQHGGIEAGVSFFHGAALQMGMLVVGAPKVGDESVSAVSGLTPYGVASVSGTSGERLPSEEEITAAQAMGARLVDISLRLQQV